MKELTAHGFLKQKTSPEADTLPQTADLTLVFNYETGEERERIVKFVKHFFGIAGIPEDRITFSEANKS